jgi:hypothetical protein
MRKGLVVTLGVVALVCVVSPGFALAPIISCVPDIIISDVEDNTQTDDLNFFIFSDALDLDDMVQDADDPSSEIRWCFIEDPQTANSIRINGIVSNPAVNILEPGNDDLRSVSQYATFENILWSGTNTTETAMDSFITLYASDGTGTDSVDIIVKTRNKTAQPYDVGPPNDGVEVALAHFFEFDTQENWEWYTFGGLTEPTAHAAGGGTMSITTTGQQPTVYGTWESSKNPQHAAPLAPKTGCVLRARYALSSPDGAACPGFRLRANWIKVYFESSLNRWLSAFTDPDFNAEQQIVYATFDPRHIAGREPGSSGQTYTLLYYPEQTETLETTGIIYLALDMLDNDVLGAGDEGTISCDRIDVDWFDNPNVGSGRLETAMSTTDFSTWQPGVTIIDPAASTTGLQISATASGITISVASGNTLFEAVARSPAVTLEPGRYYRVTYTITNSQQAGGPFGPTVRGAINSLEFIFGANKDLAGGGLLSAYDDTPSPYQFWIQAPTADAGTSPPATEDMALIFESYLLQNPNPQFGKAIQGTLGCTEVVTESWAPFP